MDRPLPGFDWTHADLDRFVERNVALVERGLENDARLSAAFEADEEAEEAAWEACLERNFSAIARHSRGVLEQFGLDPRRSVLFDRFPELLFRACDPQSPICYQPEDRQFSLIEIWGPAVVVFSHCPYTGQELPRDLSEDWSDAVDALLGTDDWSYSEIWDRLPDTFKSEAWWVERGL